DRIYVTGELGGGAAALDFLREKKKLPPAMSQHYFFPVPRIEVGRFLREKGLASSMIDLSDGLSTDLGHICDESQIGAEIQEDAVPRAASVKSGGPVAMKYALHGGDDYELLFTAPPGKRIPSRIAGVPVTQIGRITRRRSVLLFDKSGKSRKFV